MDVVTFTIIVDDIVYPNGSTSMACLGGGASLLPPSSIYPHRLLNLQHCLHVWRVHVSDEVWDMLRPAVKDLPSPYRKAKAYHVGVHSSERDVPFIKELRSTSAEAVSVEVYTHALDILTRSELQALISAGNIFSPNEKEAASLVGPGPPLEMIRRLVELGAELVSLRRGLLGCIVHRADTGETWEVPAFHTVFNGFVFDSMETDGLSTSPSVFDGAPAKVVFDPTGCGNTFCGGFLAGWL